MNGENIVESNLANLSWQPLEVDELSKCQQQSGEYGLVATFSRFQHGKITMPPKYPARQALCYAYNDPVIEIKTSKILPYNLLRRYIKGAMLQAQVKKINDGTWYAELPGFPGVWANDEISAKKATKTLTEVLEGWLLLKIEDEDKDIPIIDQIDLNEL
jgi:predicted RNase H-like HicB family nuclease